MPQFSCQLDDDDHEAIRRAMMVFQATARYPDGGLVLPDGESDRTGAMLAEICREWVVRMGRGGEFGWGDVPMHGPGGVKP